MKKLILGLGVVASCVPLATVVACDSTTVTSTNEENPKDFYLGQPEETPNQPKTEGDYSDTSKWKEVNYDPEKDCIVYEDITHLEDDGWIEGGDWENYTKYMNPTDLNSTYHASFGLSSNNGLLGRLLNQYVQFKGVEYFKQFNEYYAPIVAEGLYLGRSSDNKWIKYDQDPNDYGYPVGNVAVPYEEAYDYMHNLDLNDYPYYLPVVLVKK